MPDETEPEVGGAAEPQRRPERHLPDLFAVVALRGSTPPVEALLLLAPEGGAVPVPAVTPSLEQARAWAAGFAGSCPPGASEARVLRLLRVEVVATEPVRLVAAAPRLVLAR